MTQFRTTADGTPATRPGGKSAREVREYAIGRPKPNPTKSAKQVREDAIAATKPDPTMPAKQARADMLGRLNRAL